MMATIDTIFPSDVCKLKILWRAITTQSYLQNMQPKEKKNYSNYLCGYDRTQGAAMTDYHYLFFSEN